MQGWFVIVARKKLYSALFREDEQGADGKFELQKTKFLLLPRN